MPPCRLRRRKFDYEMVNSEVYLNKYYNNNNNHNQLDQPVITHITSTLLPFRKLLVFCMFSPFNYFIHFSRGVRQQTDVRTPMLGDKRPPESCTQLTETLHRRHNVHYDISTHSINIQINDLRNGKVDTAQLLTTTWNEKNGSNMNW